MSRIKQLEAQLSFEKRKAAQACALNEIMPEGGEKKTQEQLAEELGMSRMGLYRWRTQDPAFIEYMNLLADDMLSSHRSEVYGQLMRLIKGQQPSVKAIDLFMKRFGLLTEKQIITDNTVTDESSADIKKEAEALEDLLKEE
ncbi:phBC6A51 family helix-turn-helix protein [Bacillus safensis]|uniref:phBC6A51 family helix-turn-helix protein n=1 Tax=Bacillus safensis TaxID=561879 RepID=UPI0020CB93BC|nr:phBC6A51 family helix-turn-helix protein [Bacillus safensis]MCP9283030.1 phBC6A51 family helix-turn-helix protein [Bacillus safensis]